MGCQERFSFCNIYLNFKSSSLSPIVAYLLKKEKSSDDVELRFHKNKISLHEGFFLTPKLTLLKENIKTAFYYKWLLLCLFCLFPAPDNVELTSPIVAVDQGVNCGVRVHIVCTHGPHQLPRLNALLTPFYPPLIRHSFKICLFAAARKLRKLKYHYLEQLGPASQQLQPARQICCFAGRGNHFEEMLLLKCKIWVIFSEYV